MSDATITFTDDEMRLMVITLDLYEESVKKEIEDNGITEGLGKMLKMKKELYDKIWHTR